MDSLEFLAHLDSYYEIDDKLSKMSYKRSYGSLTGGTGDVNPQLLTFIIAQSAADTTTSVMQALPIEKFGSNKGGARIIEVLKVFYYSAKDVVETDNNIRVVLSTKNFGTTTTLENDASIFSGWQRSFDLTTSGIATTYSPQVMDLTDGAGHGFLVATDNIFAQCFSEGTSVANVVTIKILYRFKAVGLTEYIGTVQGQQ
jgi:hypothetical protein